MCHLGGEGRISMFPEGDIRSVFIPHWMYAILNAKSPIERRGLGRRIVSNEVTD